MLNFPNLTKISEPRQLAQSIQVLWSTISHFNVRNGPGTAEVNDGDNDAKKYSVKDGKFEEQEHYNSVDTYECDMEAMEEVIDASNGKEES